MRGVWDWLLQLLRRGGKGAGWAALFLLLLLWGRLWHAAAVKSDTFDEIIHIMQGVLYWQHQPLYPVVQNPPLINALIGLPVTLLFQPALPVDYPLWASRDWLRISQFFAWELNSNGLQLIWAGRLAIITLATLLGGLLYRGTSQLTGSRPTGLLALLLYSFDPNILAHAHLATTDLGMSFFLFLAVYGIGRYWQVRERRGWYYLAAGVALGCALAAKFSGLILLPALLLITLYRLWYDPEIRTHWRQTCAEPLGWLLLGGLIFLAIYRFDLAALRADFVEQQAHQLSGHSAFLAGELSVEGWWYYLPFVFLIKTPLPVLLLLVGSGMAFLLRRRYAWQIVWPLLVAGGVAGAGLVSRVNIGYRYLLPMLPLLYLFMGQVLHNEWRVASGEWRVAPRSHQFPRLSRYPLIWFAAALLTLFIAESLLFHPDYLAYFNQLVGGPKNGWRYVVDSNIDWGQDLKALADYVEEQGLGPVQVAWLGSAPLEAYGVAGVAIPIWPVAREEPLYDPFYPARPAPDVYVLSVTQLQGVYLKNPDRFAWFRAQEPTDRVGYSLLVYDVAAAGQPASLALSGIGMSHLALSDFEQAFGESNQVRPRWYDARRSLLWPGGAGESVWAAVGEGHWPEHPALQAMYPANPVLQGQNQDNAAQIWQYRLYQWDTSPVAAALQAQLPALVGTAYTDLGWSKAEVVGSQQWEQLRQPLPGPALFGEMWQLLGYTVLGEGAAQAGQPLELLSYWQVAAAAEGLYKIFVHVLDENGQIVAQDDALDVRVSGLQPGDQFAQLHTIFLPPELPAGRYALQMGLYESETFARLTIPVTVDRAVDRVLLHSFELVAR